MKHLEFVLELPAEKSIIFSSRISGLKVGRHEYKAKDDGILIYDQTKQAAADEVVCQLSTNTSTLIPALKVLQVQYNKYFDDREVVESQNDITFYWKPSYLAGFYNKYSTDGVKREKREPIIRSAVRFLTTSSGKKINHLLKKEQLKELSEKCRLLGFYEGFPIFDAAYGMPMLKSRLGIHIGEESIMVSTPLNRYTHDVVEIAKKLAKEARTTPQYKKNRVRFEKTDKLLKELGIQNQ